MKERPRGSDTSLFGIKKSLTQGSVCRSVSDDHFDYDHDHNEN